MEEKSGELKRTKAWREQGLTGSHSKKNKKLFKQHCSEPGTLRFLTPSCSEAMELKLQEVFGTLIDFIASFKKNVKEGRSDRGAL